MTTELATEQPALDAVVIDVTTELASINATDVNLTTLLSEAQALAEAGTPQSREEYDRVHDLTMVAMRVRTSAHKLAKGLAAPHQTAADAITAEGKRIGERAREAENLVRPLKEQYEDAEKQRKLNEANAKREKIVSRVNQLIRLGLTYQDAEYKGYEGTYTVEGIEVEGLDDAQWGNIIDDLTMLYNAEQERQRLAEEQRQVELKAQQDEADRIKAENERIQAEQQERQRQLDAEAKQLAQLRMDTRTERLVGMGARLEVSGHIEWLDRFVARQIDLRLMSAEDFERLIADFAQCKVEQEAEAKAQAERKQAEYELIRLRRGQLDEAGWSLKGHIWSCSEYEFTFDDRQLKDWTDQGLFDAKLTEADHWEKQRQANEKARLKANKERTARLKADKAILKKWAKAVATIPYATGLEQAETQALQTDFMQRLEQLAEQFNGEIEAL